MPRALPTSSRTPPASAGPCREPAFDWPTLIANKDREIARLEAAYTANSRTLQGRARQEPRRARGRAHRAAARHRRARARRDDPDRDRRLAAFGPTIPGLEHVISSNEAFHLRELPQAHPDPGRRLYRGRVRLHLRRPRLRGDAGLSRRQHPARLRRRRARASAHRDGASAASRSSAATPSPAIEKAGDEFVARLSDSSTIAGRQGDVRDRPRARTSRGSASSTPASSSHDHGGIAVDRLFAHLGAATSTRSATSPTASISRRSRSARATPSPTRCSATSRRRSTTPTCRPRCSPSRRSASSA